MRNVTLGKKKGIVCIALFLTFILLSSLILAEAHKIKVSAEANVLLISDPTFVDTRSKTKTSVSLNQFMHESYQLDDNNFEYIRAYQVENLIDPRYGISLGEQADAVRVNKRANMTLTGPPISQQSSLTVLTYGQGGVVSHWSNNGATDRYYNDAAQAVGVENSIFKFEYDQDSLIEILRQKSGADDTDVYIAKSNIYKSYADAGMSVGIREKEWRNVFRHNYSNFKVELNAPNGNINQPLLSLYKLTTPTSYYNYNPDDMFNTEPGNPIKDNLYDKIQNVNKHNIIIFDTDDSQQYHDYVYNQLAAILVQISYGYLREAGWVPKISMVSHSTGGNWNVMFANRHPLNVDQVITLDAPLHGSKLGRALYDAWPEISQTEAADFLGPVLRMVIVPSGFNNIDIGTGSRAERLMNSWNAATGINYSLRLTALSAFSDVDYLVDTIYQSAVPSSLQFLNPHTLDGIIAILALADFLVFAASFLTTTILVTIVFGPIAGIIAGLIVAAAAQAAFRNFVNNLLNALSPVLDYLKDSAINYGNGKYHLRDSFFIGEEASSAAGYLNAERFKKIYNATNSNKNKCNVNNILIPHNLIAHDDWAKGIVKQRIEMYSSTIFQYNVLSDSRARIDGFRPGNYESAAKIPDYIEGYAVVAIGSGAFQSRSHIRSVEIGGNIEAIGDWAFYNCTALAKVYVGRLAPGITVLGNGVFDYCLNLEAIYVSGYNGVNTYKNAANWSTYQSLIKLNFLLSNVSFIFSSGDRYIEKTMNFAAGQYYTLCVRFETAGRKIIQTFGSGDAYLELYSWNGSLLVTDDNSGHGNNAFIAYETCTNAVCYIVVRFANALDSGTIKLAITPGSSMGASNLTSYEAIDNTVISGIHTLNGLAGAGYTSLHVITPQATGTYTIEIGSQSGHSYFDTYLYVVDSTSATSYTYYDDDSGGNLQARLTLTLTAGKSYLLIVSAFDVVSQGGVYSLTVGQYEPTPRTVVGSGYDDSYDFTFIYWDIYLQGDICVSISTMSAPDNYYYNGERYSRYKLPFSLDAFKIVGGSYDMGIHNKIHIDNNSLLVPYYGGGYYMEIMFACTPFQSEPPPPKTVKNSGSLDSYNMEGVWVLYSDGTADIGITINTTYGPFVIIELPFCFSYFEAALCDGLEIFQTSNSSVTILDMFSGGGIFSIGITFGGCYENSAQKEMLIFKNFDFQYFFPKFTPKFMSS